MAVKDVCELCVYGKAAMTRMPSARGGRVTKHLQLVHSDLGGPTSEPSRGGALFFGMFTDDFSRWTDVVFLQKKRDQLSVDKKWLTKAQLHTGNKIKILRSDIGGEHVSNAFRALPDESGTTHQTTVPDTPQHNGVAKRLNRVLVEMARVEAAPQARAGKSELLRTAWLIPGVTYAVIGLFGCAIDMHCCMCVV